MDIEPVNSKFDSSRPYIIFSIMLGGLIILRYVYLRYMGLNLSTTPFVDPAGVLQVYPWDILNASAFRSGHFPLWNPYQGFGQPQIGNIQTAVFFPLKIIYYLAPSEFMHDMYIMVRHFLLGIFFFHFLLKIRLSIHAAYFAGISYGFGGYALWFVNLVDLNTQILTPLLMLSLSGLAIERTRSRLLQVMLLVCVMIFGGHPEAIFVSILFSSMYAIFVLATHHRKTAKVWLRVIFLGGLGISAGFLMASVVLLPFAEHFSRSVNFHPPGIGFFHTMPSSFISFISQGLSFLSTGDLPKFTPTFFDMNTLDIFKMPYISNSLPGPMPYFLTISFVFVLLAIIHLGKLNLKANFFGLCLIFALSLSLGLFPFRILAFLPPFSQVNNSKFYFSEISICLAVLCGYGFEYFLRSRYYVKLFFCLSFISLIFIAFFNYYSNDSILSAVTWFDQVIFIFLLASTFYIIYRSENLNRFSFLFIVTLICSAYIQSLNVKPYVDLKSDLVIVGKWPSWVNKNNLFFASSETFPPNLGIMRGLKDIRSSDALFPTKYFNTLCRLSKLSFNECLSDFYPRYFTTIKTNEFSLSQFELYKIESVFTNEDLNLPRNYELILNGPYRLYAKEPDTLFSTDANMTAFDMNNFTYENDYISHKYTALAEGDFFIPRLFYPGWNLWRDFVKLPISQNSNGLITLPFDKGLNNLSFKYIPVSFKLGLWVSLSSILLMFITFLWWARVKQ